MKGTLKENFQGTLKGTLKENISRNLKRNFERNFERNLKGNFERYFGLVIWPGELTKFEGNLVRYFGWGNQVAGDGGTRGSPGNL